MEENVKKKPGVIKTIVTIFLMIISVFFIIPMILLQMLAPLMTSFDEFADEVGRTRIHKEVRYIMSENRANFWVSRVDYEENDKNVICILDHMTLRNMSELPVVSFEDGLEIEGNGETRLYFPYTILDYGGIESISGISHIISSDVTAVPTCDLGGATLVVPKPLYDSLGDSEKEKCVPANIAYMYNYEDSPNDNYYYVDYSEESGALSRAFDKPHRPGRVFKGWYTEPECINEWDFDSGVVEVRYDEDGNVIYEEFKLYAKWSRQIYAIEE